MNFLRLRRVRMYAAFRPKYRYIGKALTSRAYIWARNQARVYLKTHDVTGSEGFLRCARHFSAGILTYFKEKWCGTA